MADSHWHTWHIENIHLNTFDLNSSVNVKCNYILPLGNQNISRVYVKSMKKKKKTWYCIIKSAGDDYCHILMIQYCLNEDNDILCTVKTAWLVWHKCGGGEAVAVNHHWHWSL